MIVLGMMGSEKENMLLNINKETRLYSIQKLPNGSTRVENDYVFLLQNTEKEDHKFYFDIIAPTGMEDKIKVLRPTEPFRVHPGVKKKKIVRLYTDELLVKDERQDTVIPLTIHAYAIDDKKKISVIRKSTFVYPRFDQLSKAH